MSPSPSPFMVMSSSEKEESGIKKQPGMSHVTFPMNNFQLALVLGLRKALRELLFNLL